MASKEYIFDGTTFYKYFKKDNDECFKITVLNHNLPLKLRGINPYKEFEICSKEKPELFKEIIKINKISNK
jgi:hypothetical protein